MSGSTLDKPMTCFRPPTATLTHAMIDRLGHALLCRAVQVARYGVSWEEQTQPMVLKLEVFMTPEQFRELFAPPEEP